MMVLHLLPMVVVVVLAENANIATADWAFMGTKYWTRNESGVFVESSIDEQAVLAYVQRNSALELSSVLAKNFKKTPVMRTSGDRAYNDDVLTDRVCPYEIRAVSPSQLVSESNII